ncbi:MAG: hypothetical protein B7Y12_08355 [Rhizobiales bacterium 24-66-13]|nr:MAG: hypothetical protein B7Y61_04815 [Rhizobiales bacterium 35-66-30]OYZ79843.1 MAG: hypothetical protein B7Y12_08355 [Rhizobiales bacterium 24-66-13]OZB07462.1 MAG: hypothetical protein B7X67_08735 [Rhizobiales bacterium 39-66-18]
MDHFADGEEIGDLAVAFLTWPEEVELIAADVAYAPRTDNVFSFPQAEPKVHIRLGSIHSVKGETTPRRWCSIPSFTRTTSMS